MKRRIKGCSHRPKATFVTFVCAKSMGCECSFTLLAAQAHRWLICGLRQQLVAISVAIFTALMKMATEMAIGWRNEPSITMRHSDITAVTLRVRKRSGRAK